MASLLLRPMLRPHALGMALGLSFATFTTVTRQRPLSLDSKSMLSTYSSKAAAQPPLLREAPLSPRTVRQISGGSIIGIAFRPRILIYEKHAVFPDTEHQDYVLVWLLAPSPDRWHFCLAY